MKKEEREEKWRLRKGRTGDWPPKGWGGSAVPETRLFYLFILFIYLKRLKHTVVTVSEMKMTIQ